MDLQLNVGKSVHPPQTHPCLCKRRLQRWRTNLSGTLHFSNCFAAVGGNRQENEENSRTSGKNAKYGLKIKQKSSNFDFTKVTKKRKSTERRDFTPLKKILKLLPESVLCKPIHISSVVSPAKIVLIHSFSCLECTDAT